MKQQRATEALCRALRRPRTGHCSVIVLQQVDVIQDISGVFGATVSTGLHAPRAALPGHGKIAILPSFTTPAVPDRVKIHPFICT